MIALFAIVIGASGKTRPADKVIVYKQIGKISLNLHVFYSPTDTTKALRPAIVFYFGGGWVKKDLDQFARHAIYFTNRGMVAILVEYRTYNPYKTSPFIAVEDAKSAMRYIRSHAAEIGVNPDKIVASGGSAGGHLAAATALIDAYNSPNDDLSISPKPQALVLFNPVIDNSKTGYAYDRIGKEYTKFSPLHNIDKNAPPTIIFLGTKDHIIPVKTVQEYQNKMQKAGVRCDIHIYDGQEHGFFNYSNIAYFRSTVYEADLFLSSLGFITGKPKTKNEVKSIKP